MSHTYVQNLLHVVFSTKERRKLIPLDHRTKLWAYMAGVCSKEKIVPHEVGGMDDHPHLSIQQTPKMQVLLFQGRTRCNIGNNGRGHDKPSAARRARRLAHGNAVGKRY